MNYSAEDQSNQINNRSRQDEQQSAWGERAQARTPNLKKSFLSENFFLPDTWSMKPCAIGEQGEPRQ